LRLLLDECNAEPELITVLTEQGHEAITVFDLGLSGLDDDVILAAATHDNRVVLTKNCRDFQSLLDEKPNHCGILLHFQDRSRELPASAIARSIARIENVYEEMTGRIARLNDCQFQARASGVPTTERNRLASGPLWLLRFRRSFR
jgi:predicted nuclease of predicted toxin-antitoxin system